MFNLDECYLRNETDKIDIFPFQTNVFHLPDFKCVLCEYCQVNYENKYQLPELLRCRLMALIQNFSLLLSLAIKWMNLPNQNIYPKSPSAAKR